MTRRTRCCPSWPREPVRPSRTRRRWPACSGTSEARASDVPERLARYETLRKPRATRVQQGSFENATTYHLPDGPAQEARDARYAALAREAPYAARGWLFEHDAEAAIP